MHTQTTLTTDSQARAANRELAAMHSVEVAGTGHMRISEDVSNDAAIAAALGSSPIGSGSSSPNRRRLSGLPFGWSLRSRQPSMSPTAFEAQQQQQQQQVAFGSTGGTGSTSAAVDLMTASAVFDQSDEGAI
jgi:hypothetical protein